MAKLFVIINLKMKCLKVTFCIVLGCYFFCFGMASICVFAASKLQFVASGEISYDPYVVTNDTKSYTNLADALNDANDGDVLTVKESLNISKTVNIDKNICLVSNNDITIKTKNFDGSIFEVNKDKTFSVANTGSKIELVSTGDVAIQNYGFLTIGKNCKISNVSSTAILGGDVTICGGTVLGKISCANIEISDDACLQDVCYSENFLIKQNANVTIDQIIQLSQSSMVPVILGYLTSITKFVPFQESIFEDGSVLVQCSETNITQVMENLICNQYFLKQVGATIQVENKSESEQSTIVLMDELGEIENSYLSWTQFCEAIAEDEELSFDSGTWTLHLAGTISFDQTAEIVLNRSTFVVSVDSDLKMISQESIYLFEFSSRTTSYVQISLNGNAFLINNTSILCEEDALEFFECSTKINLSLEE